MNLADRSTARLIALAALVAFAGSGTRTVTASSLVQAHSSEKNDAPSIARKSLVASTTSLGSAKSTSNDSIDLGATKAPDVAREVAPASTVEVDDSTYGGLPTGGAIRGAARGQDAAEDVLERVKPGTGELINRKAATAPPPVATGVGKAVFNFEGEALHAVVKAILGDLLEQNYVIAPGVQGTVTLAAQSVNAEQARSILEMVLGWNSARLVWSDGRYNIVPADKAVAGNLAPRLGAPTTSRGYEVRAIPLQFIAAQEMEKLLNPYIRERAVVSVDAARNLLVLAGTSAELALYLRTIEIFDVDWLAGMSVGVFPLQSAEAGKIVAQLNELFGENGKTPLAGMFRFMPMEGANAVLVITPQAKYLADIKQWIERLDSGADGLRLYMYDVKYVKAQDLGDRLSEIFGGQSGAHRQSPAVSLAPGLEPISIASVSGSSSGQVRDGAARGGAATAPAGIGAEGLSLGGGDLTITAVEENNALLIRTNTAQWEAIQQILKRLDVMPLQVHIESQVIEVDLQGNLSYGVNWFLENAIPNQVEGSSLSGLRERAQGRTLWGDIAGTVSGAGAKWTWLGRNALATIQALDAVSDVRVLSTPSVLVRNNVEATLNVGQSIPITTTSFNPIEGGGGPGTGNFSTVQYLQTGVILKVKPRVGSDGMVFMEINQEVSSPGARLSLSDPNVPINTRTLTTETAVRSGETVMLAGLIKQDESKGKSGVPGLSRIPGLGALFGSHSDSNNRSEVVIFITPTVIRDPQEAQDHTERYGRSFKALEPLSSSKK